MGGSGIETREPAASGDAKCARDEFLAMLGHELRNPLAAICNAAQLLNVSGATEQEQRFSREVILRQARLLARLVDDLVMPVPPPEPLAPRPSPGRWAWHPWHHRRVLVVDDNPDVAKVLALLIGSLGFKVRTVPDGRQVAAEIADFKPRTVFLDLDLPGLDGYAVAEELRQRAFGAHLRLIALSGWGPERKPARSAALPDFDHYLVKPVDSGMLKRILIGPAAAGPALPDG